MASKTSVNLLLFFVSCYSFTSPCFCNTISQGQELRDGEALVSANKVFRLQFFSPGTSQSRYLGIFYIIPPRVACSPDDQRAVWVANRDNPIPDASGKLMIDIDGKLILSYGGTNAIVFNSVLAVNNADATLLDNGNLVLREMNSDDSVKRTLWQSFDYPTDTLLPGMKLGINFRTGHRWILTSRISDAVPASGSFTLGIDPNGTAQLIVWWRGDVYWTSGLWRNGTFDNASRLQLSSDRIIRFSYVSSEDEKYFMYSVDENKTLTKYSIDPSGVILERGEGVISACALPGTPSDAGCVKILPNCKGTDFWVEQKNVKFLGDSYKFDDNYNLSLFDCKARCMANCTCIAYASITDNGTGCEIWENGMSFALRDISEARYIYLLGTKREPKIFKWLTISIFGATVIPLLCGLCCWGWTRGFKAKRRISCELGNSGEIAKFTSKKRGQELQVFSFESITAATDNFSAANKLGAGGFGPVYKGELPDGQLVAIKRLSRSSGQGVIEFKNEILLISKLQHNNLVRLLGSCIKGKEKLLIYEYMPNKSLDFFLFNPSSECLLDWKKRLNVIEGIAQGLLYLHKYSRLRIIHRDLKASNILLDDEWNPKISDFGLARIFEQHEYEANTKRIVGTIGYMSPEYATTGTFSIKSDVFSFGVLLLEIVSGKKNNSSYHSERPLNLIGWAWELWKQGRSLEVMDPKIAESYQSDQVLRCIHVSLLCVQENPSDRPTMSDVVFMITNGASPNSIPKRPAFYIRRSSTQSSSDATAKRCSLNTMTISEIQAR